MPVDEVRRLVNAIDDHRTEFSSPPFISKKLRKLVKVPEPISNEKKMDELQQKIENKNEQTIDKLKEIKDELKEQLRDEFKQQMSSNKQRINLWRIYKNY